MRAHGRRPLLTVRHLLVLMGLLLILAAGSAVYVGATVYQQSGATHVVEPTPPTPTPHPPRGRRWFYEAPLWPAPEQAQP